MAVSINPAFQVSLAVSGSKSIKSAGRASTTMAIESTVPRASRIPSSANS